MAKDGLMAIATYTLLEGKEEEFLDLFYKGLVSLTEKMGGHQVSIYYHKEKSRYVATAHWPSKSAFDKYSEAPALESWMKRIHDLCREPTERELFSIVEERAA